MRDRLLFFVAADGGQEARREGEGLQMALDANETVGRFDAPYVLQL